jgi:ATP-dependent DNA helicase RecG
VRNFFRYGPEYARGAVPEMVEGDVFKTVIPLRVREIAQVGTSADWSQVRSKFGAWFGVNTEKILELLFQDPGLSAAGIAERIDISIRAVEKQLARLKEMGLLKG